jgi:uncharacterized membrane protein
MHFLAKAYCIVFPLLLILFSYSKNQKIAFRILFVGNLLMLLNSVFIIRQWMGVYYLTQQFHKEESGFRPTDYFGSLFYVQVLILLLPLFFFIKKKLVHIIIGTTLFVLVLSFQITSIFYSLQEIVFDVLNYISLFIGVYALFWLMKKLPYQ